MFTDNENTILAGLIDIEDETILNGLERVVRRYRRKRPYATHKNVKDEADDIHKFAVNELGASKKRKALLERLPQLGNKKLIQDLIKGVQQISDAGLYAVAKCEGSTISLIPTDSKIKTGKMSFAGAKFDKFALIHGIYLLYSEGDSEASEKFDKILPTQVVNGDFTMKVDTKPIIYKLPVQKFVSTAMLPTNKPFNYVELDHPKWIVPDKDLAIDIELTEALNDGFMKCVLDVSIIQSR